MKVISSISIFLLLAQLLYNEDLSLIQLTYLVASGYAIYCFFPFYLYFLNLSSSDKFDNILLEKIFCLCLIKNLFSIKLYNDDI